MTQQPTRQSFPDRTPHEILCTIASPVGPDSRSIFDAAALAHNAVFQSPGRAPVVQRAPGPKPFKLEEQLYDVRAAFKLRTNMVAMHFGADWQKKFFQQLDSLLDAEEWDHDDPLIAETAFKTLLRILLVQRGKLRPGLGVGPNGTVVAAWTTGANRLTLECGPADNVRWMVSLVSDGKTETAAGQTKISDLFQRLSGFNSEQWFTHDGR